MGATPEVQECREPTPRSGVGHQIKPNKAIIMRSQGANIDLPIITKLLGPKTCCRNKLASQRMEACAVSKGLLAVLSLALAPQCSLLTRSAKWPLPLTWMQTLTADCVSSSCPEQRLAQIVNELQSFCCSTRSHKIQHPAESLRCLKWGC